MKPIDSLISKAKKLNLTIIHSHLPYCLTINEEVDTGKYPNRLENSISLTIFNDKDDKIQITGICGIGEDLKNARIHI